MKNFFILSVLGILCLSLAGCDNGKIYRNSKVPSKVKVHIVRTITAEGDKEIVIYAQSVSHGPSDVSLSCPCYFAEDPFDVGVMLEVEENLKLKMLPGAQYRVEVEHWAPNSDQR